VSYKIDEALKKPLLQLGLLLSGFVIEGKITNKEYSQAMDLLKKIEQEKSK
jgi:hypothetical protein